MKSDTYKLTYRIITFFVIALLFECIVMNFRTLESITFTDSITPSYHISSNGTLDSLNQLSFTPGGACTIEILDINKTIKNMYLDLSLADEAGDIDIQISAKDSGNELYYTLPKLKMRYGHPEDHYIKLNLNGQAKSLKIEILSGNSKVFQLNTLAFNVKRPMFFSLLRVFLIFLILVIIYLFRPASEIYTIKYSFKSFAQQAILILIACIQITFVATLSLSNPNYVSPPWAHHHQYEYLAESITKGKLYLDIEPSAKLQAMENPYDRQLRKSEHVSYMWDTAYYNGKYYVYFGVLPVIVFYLPYYLVTGEGFPTVLGIDICLIFIIIGFMFLLHRLSKLYFKNISLGQFILMDLLLFFSSAILKPACIATFYALPILMALALTVWGIYFWFNGLKKSTLCAGSICMALVAACRPQFLIGSFLCIPLLAPKLKKQIVIIKSRDNADQIPNQKNTQLQDLLKKLLFFILPYIIVAILLMLYNNARFGSPFDFGANYNLTTNDMTSRGFHLDRLPLGLYMYLIQPPTYTTAFPFLRYVVSDIMYQGKTIIEHLYGGFIWLCPIAMILFALPKITHTKYAKKLLPTILFLLFGGIIVVCADTQMAGILFRYFLDFGFFITLAAILFTLSINEEIISRNNSSIKKLWQKLLCAITLITGIQWILVIYNLL